MRRSSLSCETLALLVVLALCAPPLAAASHTWSGGGATVGWSDAGNWSAGGPPTAAEGAVDLAFPAAQAQMATMTNDVAGLNVSSITFSDTAYRLSGQAINLAGTISVNGGTSYGAARIDADIVLTGPSSLVSWNDSALPGNPSYFLTIPGAISGAADLTVSCAAGGYGGEVILSGANTYSGVTTVTSGYLVQSSAQALGAADGTPATGTVVQPHATLVIWSTVSGETLSLSGDGANGNSALQTNGPATWNGPITLAGPATVTGLAGLLTLAGPIGDGGSGFGFDFRSDVVLSGTNSYTGGDRLEDGTVTVNGTNAAAFTTNYYGSGGGTLRGSGSVNGIVAGGAGSTNNAVAPGTAATTGTLTSTAAVTLDTGATLQIRIGGPNSGIDADQLFVTAGGTTLANSPTLSVSLVGGYVAPLGTQFTIVDNSETGATTGTFAGLSEGATFTVGLDTFQIAYAGGPLSNNVVLTVTAVTPVELTTFSAR